MRHQRGARNVRPVFRRHPLLFVEVAHLSRDLNLHAIRVESRDAPHAADALGAVAFQYASRPMPFGAIAPIPVTTIRRFIRYGTLISWMRRRGALAVNLCGTCCWVCSWVSLAASSCSAWFALISPMLGHPWWLIPNLFASHFYNSREVYARARAS